MIQFWTSGTTSPSTNIIIRGNVLNSASRRSDPGHFHAERGRRLGVAGIEMFYRNILIEDNVIYNAVAHGITVGETDGLTVRNNTILHNRSDPTCFSQVPTIILSDISTNVVVINNIVPRLSLQPSPNAIVENNLIVQRDYPNVPNFYGDLFLNALADGTLRLPISWRCQGGLSTRWALALFLTNSRIS